MTPARRPSVLLLCLACVGLISCSAPPAETARCFADNATPEQFFAAGQKPTLLTRDACTGGNLVEGMLAVFASDDAYKESVRAEFETLAQDNKSFRQGQYAALAEKSIRLEPSALSAAGELGLLMEEVAGTRLEVLWCGKASAGEIELVGQLDSLFSLAVSGVRLGAPDLADARIFAGQMLERAVSQANARAPAVPLCDDALVARFKEHLAQWEAFYEGKHPWAEGCRAFVSEKEFVLKCE